MKSFAKYLLLTIALVQLGVSSALRCRVEHDDRTQEDFQDVVRACMGVNFQDEQTNRPHKSNNNNWRHQSQWGHGLPRFPTKDNSGGNSQREDSEEESSRGSSQDHGYYNNKSPGNTQRGGGSGYKPRTRRAASSPLFNPRTGSMANHTSRSHQNTGSPLEEVEPCVIHCMFRQMRMLDRNNQLDQSAAKNAMTSKLRDPELKEFIQDSIAECFDIMESETQDTNCAFSKSFAMCLEQKGQQNCEDWDDAVKPHKRKDNDRNFNKYRG